MKKSFFLLGVIVAMASCAKSDIYDVNQSNPDVITFGTYVGQTTKGSVFDQEAIQTSGFGLMAYYTGQNAWNDSEVDGSELAFDPNFMYNQSVIYSNSAWSYSPIKYWPNQDDDKVTFFAYAPYETTANRVKASYTANTATGRPQIEFTLQDKAADMIDFVAGQNMDMLRQQDKVTFNLKHQLTRATFTAKTNVDNVSDGAFEDGDGGSYIVIRSMDIVDSDDNQFYTKGIYTFGSETTNADKADHNQDGSWQIDATSADSYSFASILNYNNVKIDGSKNPLQKAGYTTSCVILPIASSNYTSLFASGEYLFLLPPAGAKGLDTDNGSIEIEIVYDIVAIDSELAAGHLATTTTSIVSLPTGTLAQGKAYNYQLTFDVTEVLVKENIVDWNDENEDTDGGIIDPFKVVNPVTEIKLEGKTIYVGQTATLVAYPSYTTPGEDSSDTFSWLADSSDYVSLQTDDQDDTTLEVTGVEVGTSEITVTSRSGTAVSATITVLSSEGEFSTPANGTLEIGDTFTPVAGENNPEGLVVAWSSSKEAVVSVDSESGAIEAVAPGKATITAKDQFGNLVKQYDVIVLESGADFERIDIAEFGYLKLFGSEIFAQGYDASGTAGTLSLTAVSLVDKSSLAVTITGSDGITIDSNDAITSVDFSGEIGFTATQSGTITIKNGNAIIKEIPVKYAVTPISYLGSKSVGGAALGAVTSVVADNADSANHTAMITADGSIDANSTYSNREFRGSVITSAGTIKVYCKQASNFGLMNDIEETELNTTETIVYQSTGNIYTVNGVNVAEIENTDVRKYSVMGDVSLATSGDATFSNFNNSNALALGSTFAFWASNIGTNQSGEYDAAKSYLENSTVVTLTNSANETKTYTITAEQYALPYCDKGSPYYSGTPADTYGSRRENNRGETISTVTIYNCFYQNGGVHVGDWWWQDTNDYNTSSVFTQEPASCGNETIKNVAEAAGVSASKIGENCWRFETTVSEVSTSTTENDGTAWFGVKTSNQVGESVIMNIQVTRQHDGIR